MSINKVIIILFFFFAIKAAQIKIDDVDSMITIFLSNIDFVYYEYSYNRHIGH